MNQIETKILNCSAIQEAEKNKNFNKLFAKK